MHDKTHMERIDVPLDDSLREHLELRAAIQAGIDSGVSERSPEQIWEEAKHRHRATSV